ncbi:MAG: glycosyltransferase family 1 protein [Patescibacteria group bacterium]|jgi:glycosyltransferase involved in cell wall biosynthesis
MSHKILIDGRFIGVGDSIGRVVFGILEHLLQIDDQNQYSLLIRPAGVAAVKEHGLWDRKRVKIEVLDIPHYSLDEQTKLFVWLNKKPYDLVYFTQFNHPVMYKRPYVIIIHDMTTFGYFRYENPLKVAMFKKVMKSAVMNSKKVIVDSETTKKEILEYFKVDPNHIEVIYLGVDAGYQRIAKMDQADRMKLGQKFKKNYSLEGNYLLYTGMWKKHKNLPRLLRAIEQVESRKSKVESDGIQLVLAGKIDYNEPEIIAEIERINKVKLDQLSNLTIEQLNNLAVRPIGFVPEVLLSAAYAGALAYIQPSLNEGFGLPPLEAMACGAPVIASNISATPEVLEDAAHYFDPENVSNMAKKILEVVDNQRLRLNLRKKGLEQVKKYTWQKNAKKNLMIIEEALEI